MYDMFTAYLLLALLIYVINVIPALMPPTWTILVFTVIKFNLHVVPSVLLGAISATLGRITLYYLARTYLRPFLSEKTKKNMDALGKFLNARSHLTVGLVVIYAFFPIPSNQVYIAAGLAKVNIKLFALSFFIGRIISYAFWVGTTSLVIDKLLNKGLRFTHLQGFLIDILGFAILILVSKIRWDKILSKHIKT